MVNFLACIVGILATDTSCLSQDSSRIVYRQYWQMLSPAQPGHKNRPHLWLVGQIKNETMRVLWLCYDYMSINFDIRTKFWYLSQSHPSSLSLGLWDQWIYCHSRIKNNEDKCYGQTNENIHVHRLQHAMLGPFSMYEQPKYPNHYFPSLPHLTLP
jgi:hypothetical protein